MTTSLILSDELLDHWGTIFVDNNLYEKGITFEQFIAHSDVILQAAVFGTPMPLLDEFYPLLPQQIIVQKKVDNAESVEQLQQDIDNHYERQGHIVEMHGHCNIERIHKRSFPKRYKTGMKRKLKRAS